MRWLGFGMMTVAATIALLATTWWAPTPGAQAAPTEPTLVPPHRSPIALVLSADEKYLITANHTAHSVSLVDVAAAKVLHELPVSQRPQGLAFIPGGNRVLVTTRFGGDLLLLEHNGRELRQLKSLFLNFEPYGVVVDADGKFAYVTLSMAAEVAVVDLAKWEVVAKIPAGRWPHSLALSPDGTRLAVASSGDRTLWVIDVAKREPLYDEPFGGINIGQLQTSRDNKYVYLPWMVYRQNPITEGNIKLGWVLGSRVARIKLDGAARREAITLDPPGRAVADPYGLAISSSEQTLAVSSAGTHELLVYRLPGLPFQDYGGPGDHIDRQLLNDRRRFYRIELGGRPMEVRFSKDERRVFVANYLLDCIQVVDVQDRSVMETISLGGPATDSLARQGETIFYDAARSLDQWYSCHSCHQEGDTNAVVMDTFNDGTPRTFKTVLSLHHVADTKPWTWHGWQTDLHGAMKKSLTETMLGPQPTDADAEALLAYLKTMQRAPNPYRERDGKLTAAAQRGQVVFESKQAGCTNCHKGQYFTDGGVHDVNTGSERDAYEGYNTPSLLGVYQRVQYLHDGRAKTLEQLLTGPHDPATVAGERSLTAEELNDLIAYLKSL